MKLLLYLLLTQHYLIVDKVELNPIVSVHQYKYKITVRKDLENTINYTNIEYHENDTIYLN